jgi:hypothetical protein
MHAPLLVVVSFETIFRITDQDASIILMATIQLASLLIITASTLRPALKTVDNFQFDKRLEQEKSATTMHINLTGGVND